MNEPSPPNGAGRRALVYLVLGLIPIPILLLMAAMKTPPSGGVVGTVVAVCGGCSLAGGIGCVGRVRNIGVRIGLGLLLGVVFMVLSWFVALLEACSKGGF